MFYRIIYLDMLNLGHLHESRSENPKDLESSAQGHLQLSNSWKGEDKDVDIQHNTQRALHEAPIDHLMRFRLRKHRCP